MEKQTEMYRYEIPVWNRDGRPAWIDSIRSKDNRLFLQLLQEKMNAYKSRVYNLSASCFLQIVKRPYPHTVAYQLYIVSMNSAQENDALHRLTVELIESRLEVFLSEQDWNKRLQEDSDAKAS